VDFNLILLLWGGNNTYKIQVFENQVIREIYETKKDHNEVLSGCQLGQVVERWKNQRF